VLQQIALYKYLIFLCLCMSSVVMAETSRTIIPVLISDANSEHIELGNQLRFIEDPDSQLTIDDIMTHQSPRYWQMSRQTVPNFGFTESTHWFYVQLSNPSTQSVSRLLELSYPLVDHLDFYLVHQQQILKTYKMGDAQPLSARPIDHRHFLVPLDIPAKQQVDVYIRVQTEGSLQLPLDLWTLKGFFHHDQWSFFLQLIVLGIMAGLGVYNFFLLIATRHMSYLWYVLTIGSISLLILSLYGISAEFIWPNLPILNNYSLINAISLSLTFSALFAYNFLKLGRQSWWVRTICFSFVAAGIVLFILGFLLPYSQVILISTLLTVVEAFAAILLGSYLWSKGDQLAKFYTIAWSSFMLGAVALVLSKWGVLPSNRFTDNILQVGYVSEGFLLSFALAYRMNVERKQRDQARQDILRMQREANHALELRVQERTIELEQANQALRELNAKDGLTGVFNRLYFEETFDLEWQRGSRFTTPLCLMMIDADHFKSINDQYGHLCGDACLRHLAKCCHESVSRAGDFVARYGGEEFVMLLSSTSLVGACLIAERVRRTIADTPFEWQGHTLSLTVSIGVACCIPEIKQNAKRLVGHADQACYAAKASGRNAVYVYQDTDQTCIALDPLLKNKPTTLSAHRHRTNTPTLL
jgi:diguanylate cyclase (GGDEF)-like protein